MLNNKNKKIKIFFFLLLMVFFIFLVNNAKAELIKLNLKNSPPCLPEGSNCGDTSRLEYYINLIARFALGIGGFLAMGMILIGAFLITVSGSVDKTKEGQSYITSALLGLALLLGSYLILKEINPNLVILTPPTAPALKLPEGKYGGSATISGDEDRQELYNRYCNSPKEDEKKTIEEHKKVLKDLRNVTTSFITNKGDNEDKMCLCRSGCTSLAYMPERAISFLKDLYNESKCQITITGGTEFEGHKSHAPGRAMVDIRETQCLANFIKNKQKFDELRRRYGLTMHNCQVSRVDCSELNKIYSSDFCKTLECESHFHFNVH